MMFECICGVCCAQEAAPVEDLFSAQRQEQQRRWLQELDKQREEDKLRRQHDKEINSQVNSSRHDQVMSSLTPVCKKKKKIIYIFNI